MSAAQHRPPLGTTQIPISTLGKLHDRIAELEAVARRYRWLTRTAFVQEVFTDEGVRYELDNFRTVICKPGDSVDAAIDAAMAKRPGSTS